MTPAARVAAAMEIMGEIEARRRPAADLLREWGQSHRFAGSKDRTAIAGLVWDTLRVKSSAAWLMAAEGPRAQVLGALARARARRVAGGGSVHGRAPCARAAHRP